MAFAELAWRKSLLERSGDGRNGMGARVDGMRNNWVGVPGRESSWVLSIGEAVRAVAWVIWCRLVHMCCCVLLGGSRTYHHRHLLE